MLYDRSIACNEVNWALMAPWAVMGMMGPTGGATGPFHTLHLQLLGI